MTRRRRLGLLLAAGVLAGCAAPHSALRTATTAPASTSASSSPSVSADVVSLGPVRSFTGGNVTFAVPRSWADGIAMARSLVRLVGPGHRPQGGDVASQAASGYGLALTRLDAVPDGAADGVAVQLPATLLDTSDIAWPTGAWAAEAHADNGVVPVVLTVVAPDRATAEAVAGSFRRAGG